MNYVALLRGINVGGNNIVPMSELKECFEALHLKNVKTFINSGNVLFETDETDQVMLRSMIEKALENHFKIVLRIVLVDSERYQRVIKNAPAWWGKDATWKHNLIFLIEPYEIQDVVKAVGMLKPEIEAMKPGDGVLYQSMSFEKFGRTTAGKLAANPIYKKMTIRNFNTASKLALLLATE